MGFLLTPLGFPCPITLSLILGAHGLAINPLLSLFALLRACCGPFSLFYITYCPWICHFSLSGLLKAHLFILWACNPLFLPFWLNGFFCPFTNSFLPMLLGFFFLLDFPKWSSIAARAKQIPERVTGSDKPEGNGKHVRARKVMDSYGSGACT